MYSWVYDNFTLLQLPCIERGNPLSLIIHCKRCSLARWIDLNPLSTTKVYEVLPVLAGTSDSKNPDPYYFQPNGRERFIAPCQKTLQVLQNLLLKSYFRAWTVLLQFFSKMMSRPRVLA